MLQPLFKQAQDKFKIAVIEDDLSIYSLIEQAVQSSMTDVDFMKFTNAHDAIYDLWENGFVVHPKIDLLFLDIHLAGKTNGLDILEYCQYLPENVPVVLMSSEFTPEQVDTISKMRIKPVLLRKPFGPAEIISLARWGFRFH